MRLSDAVTHTGAKLFHKSNCAGGEVFAEIQDNNFVVETNGVANYVVGDIFFSILGIFQILFKSQCSLLSLGIVHSSYQYQLNSGIL